MTISDFKDLAQSAQSLAFVLAVFGGGFWTVMTARFFFRKKMDESELRGLELQNRKFEIEAYTQAVVNLSITESQIVLPGNNNIYLRVIVDAENVGTRNCVMLLEKAPLRCTEVVVSESGALPIGSKGVEILCYSDSWGSPDSADEDELGYRPMLALRSGMRWQWQFVVLVPRPGLYNFEFSSRVSPSDLDEMNKISFDPDVQEWSTESYALAAPVKNVDGAARGMFAKNTIIMEVISWVEFASVNVHTAWLVSESDSEAEDQLYSLLENCNKLRTNIYYGSDGDLEIIEDAIGYFSDILHSKNIVLINAVGDDSVDEFVKLLILYKNQILGDQDVHA